MIATKEIKLQIEIIKNTKKITSAMEMVSASKMRKLQNRMLLSRYYTKKIKEICNRIVADNINEKNNYININKKIKKICYIIITSDKGLCGGLNIKLFKKLLNYIKKDKKEYCFCTIGKIGKKFIKKYGGEIIYNKNNLGDYPKIIEFYNLIKIIIKQYDNNHIDCIKIIYNKSINSIKSLPKIKNLLPLKRKKEKIKKIVYIYETYDFNILLKTLFTKYLESQIYQAILENIASEHSLRMISMKKATENANELIRDLNNIYNKLRQENITQEISEIVNGAALV
ncbi:ATP synthase F1 subunit gamma [Candidatus Portiera aleyrodidarum]|uniref:ATP synthase gamma chain n=1 Tax=Candidatus Portiera aleyrodidarum TaxID=91844 RepID=A0A8D9JQ80_9GAMM|nr:ATP synthase F1 subunit gamma [Candidatus Portiera aleyrodidarum]CEI58830.1 ATP synthase gamma chain [Candidatus Portiera aleyrodidarum]